MNTINNVQVKRGAYESHIQTVSNTSVANSYGQVTLRPRASEGPENFKTQIIQSKVRTKSNFRPQRVNAVPVIPRKSIRQMSNDRNSHGERFTNSTARPVVGTVPGSLKLASRKKLKAVLQVAQVSYHLDGGPSTVSGQQQIEAAEVFAAEYARLAIEGGPSEVIQQSRAPTTYDGSQQHANFSVKQSVKQLSEYTRNNKAKKETCAVSKLDISHASHFSQESPLKVDKKLQLQPIEKTANYNPKRADAGGIAQNDIKTYEIALDAAIQQDQQVLQDIQKNWREVNKRIVQRANLLQTLQQNSESEQIPLNHATILETDLLENIGLQSTDSGIDIGSDGAFEDLNGYRYSRQGAVKDIGNAYHSQQVNFGTRNNLAGVGVTIQHDIPQKAQQSLAPPKIQLYGGLRVPNKASQQPQRYQDSENGNSQYNSLSPARTLQVQQDDSFLRQSLGNNLVQQSSQDASVYGIRRSSNIAKQQVSKRRGNASQAHPSELQNPAQHHATSPDPKTKFQNDIRQVAQLYRKGTIKGNKNQHHYETMATMHQETEPSGPHRSRAHGQSQSRERGTLVLGTRTAPAGSKQDEAASRKRTVDPTQRIYGRHNVQNGNLITISHNYGSQGNQSAHTTRRLVQGQKGAEKRRLLVPEASISQNALKPLIRESDAPGNSTSVSVRKGISKSTMRQNIRSLNNYTKNAPNSNISRKLQHTQSVVRERAAASNGRAGRAAPRVGQASLVVNHLNRVQLKQSIQHATYQSQANHHTLDFNSNQLLQSQNESNCQALVREGAVKTLASISGLSGNSGYIKNRQLDLQQSSMSQEAQTLQVGRYPSKMRDDIRGQHRIHQTSNEPDSQGAARNAKQLANIRQENPMVLNVHVGRASNSVIRAGRGGNTGDGTQSPVLDRMPHRNQALQAQAVRQKGQPNVRVHQPKPHLKKQANRPQKKEEKAQTIALKKFYQSSTSRAESVPPAMKNSGTNGNQGIQNQYGSVSSGRLGGQSQGLRNQTRPGKIQANIQQFGSNAGQAKHSAEGTIEEEQLQYREQNMLLGVGMSTQGISEFANDMVELTQGSAGYQPHHAGENGNQFSNQLQFIQSSSPLGRIAIPEDQQRLANPGIISNQFSFKTINQAATQGAEKDGSMKSKGVSKAPRFVEDSLNDPKTSSRHAIGKTKDNVISTKTSVHAQKNQQRVNNNESDPMTFSSLNQQALQAKLQYFQSCDHQNLLQVLQKQMQNSNLGPDARQDIAGERYAFSLEELGSLEQDPAEMTEVVGYLNKHVGGPTFEHKSQKPAFRTTKAHNLNISDFQDKGSNNYKQQYDRDNKILISQIIADIQNPHSMSINEAQFYSNKRSNFQGNFQDFEQETSGDKRQGGHDETITSSNLVMNHRDRQNIKEFLSAHHSGGGLGGLGLDSLQHADTALHQKKRPGEKRDSENINIISQIFDNSQQLNTYQHDRDGRAAQLEAVHPNLDASYLKNTSANPLLNDSINRSQLSGMMNRGGRIVQESAYGKSQVGSSDLQRVPEAGVRERLNQRYQASETKGSVDQEEREEMNGIDAEEEQEDEQLECWSEDGEDGRVTSYRQRASLRGPNAALPVEGKGMDKHEHSSSLHPILPSEGTGNQTTEEPECDQDTDEEEEIVGEILTSEHDKSNANILVTEDNSVNLGYKPSGRTANYRQAEPTRKVDEDAGSESRSTNQQNAKKLIPFDADDEDDDLNADGSGHSISSRIRENEAGLESARKSITRDLGLLYQEQQEAPGQELRLKDILAAAEVHQAPPSEQRPQFVRKRVRQAKPSEAQGANTTLQTKIENNSSSDRQRSQDPTEDRGAKHIILSTNSTAVGLQNTKDNLNNSKTTVSTLHTFNPTNPNRKSTFLFGSRQGNMFAQNNLRYSQQTAAGGYPGMLQKLQMKSVALAKINQITGHNVRPKFAGEQPSQQPGSEEKQFSLVANIGHFGLQNQNVLHMQKQGKEYQYEQLSAINSKDDQNLEQTSMVEDRMNLMSMNSNPQSQRVTPLGFNQISCIKHPINNFAIGEEQHEVSEKHSSDPDKINDKITERYGEEQSQSRESRSAAISQQEASGRYGTSGTASLPSKPKAEAAFPPTEQLDAGLFHQKFELIQSVQSLGQNRELNDDNTPSHECNAVTMQKFSSVARAPPSTYDNDRESNPIQDDDSMDNIMIESFQSQSMAAFKDKFKRNDKSNEYVKQFENNFVDGTSRSKVSEKNSRHSPRDNVMLSADSMGSSGFEDSTGVLDRTRMSGGPQANFLGDSRVPKIAPFNNEALRGGQRLPTLRFGQGEGGASHQGLTQSEKSTPVHSDDEVTPRRGLDELMSESKLLGLRDLDPDNSEKQIPTLNFMDSSKQIEPLTDKIVKTSKIKQSATDLISDLNDRDIDASIVIKPTLKNQLKLQLNQRAPDNLHSSRILRNPKGRAEDQGGFDARASAGSSDCNILESSRTAQSKAGGGATSRRPRYDDDDDQ